MATLRKGEDKAAGRYTSTTQPSRLALQPYGLGPFGLLQRMFSDIERLTDMTELSQASTAGAGQRGAAGLWAPRIDVLRRKDGLIVRADLPGISPDNVTVEVRNNALILEGQRSEESEDDSDDVYRMERAYGMFRRIIELPPNVDPSRIEARFENGVLEVKVQLPREEERGHRVPIQSQDKRQVGSGATGATGEGQPGRGGAQASGATAPAGIHASGGSASPGPDQGRR